MSSQNKRPSFFRRTLVVNNRVQFTVLLASIFMACIWSIMTVVISAVFTHEWDHPSRPMLTIGFCAAIVFISTVYLILIITNRIAGPIYRLQLELKRVAEGGAAAEVVVRDEDILKPLVDEYNRIVPLIGQRKL